MQNKSSTQGRQNDKIGVPTYNINDGKFCYKGLTTNLEIDH